MSTGRVKTPERGVITAMFIKERFVTYPLIETLQPSTDSHGTDLCLADYT